MLITVINYLDRGTLNYMWVANIEYNLENEIDNNLKINQAVKEGDTYKLVKSNGEEITAKAANISIKEKNGNTLVVNKEGIAYDLGLISADTHAEEAAKQAKDMLGTITIFFMIAYGISQLVSGKLYDKIGTRKGFSYLCFFGELPTL